MPNINEMFPSKYLKASDLQGREVVVVISEIAPEEFEGNKGVERKFIVYFQGKEKGLVLNRTNADTIAHAYGEDSDDWIGREVILFSMRVKGPQGMTDGLRLRIPSRNPGYQLSSNNGDGVKVTRNQPATELPSDDIPF